MGASLVTNALTWVNYFQILAVWVVCTNSSIYGTFSDLGNLVTHLLQPNIVQVRDI